MNRDLIAGCLIYLAFNAFGFFIRLAPKRLGLFLGRRIGGLLYYFDRRHRAIAYCNIKSAFGKEFSPRMLRNITRRFYRSFVQNLFEIFYIPLINEKYFKRYVSFEGVENIERGFSWGKGVILLAVHEGSWELSNIISSNLGFPFSMFVRDQKRYGMVEELLNVYRQKKGCKLIQRQNQTRQLIGVLRNNEAVGMTLDQGGKSGTLVDFFGRQASMANGAVRLALRYDTAIVPVFLTRVKGPYIKIFIEPPFKIIKTGDGHCDIRDNLQRLAAVFEKYIRQYPYEYLWTYKIWKYGRQKNILILSDGKAGHLRQSQAAAGIIAGQLKENGIEAKTEVMGAAFKNRLSRLLLTLASFFSHGSSCQGCLFCPRMFLKKEDYDSLSGVKPDIIISCGSSLAGLNLILARENQAKSVVIMRPGFLAAKRFDLVIIPEHDALVKGKNIAVTQAALNLIDGQYLKEESDKLMRSSLAGMQLSDLRIGLLIGGDTKDFKLKKEAVSEVVRQIKLFCEKFNADLLITTSRRTPKPVEDLLKKEFAGYPGCKLLIIAKERNLPEAVGGILGLSSIVVSSPESISMISEAVSSNKYTFIFKAEGLSRRHKAFISSLAEGGYIYQGEPEELAESMQGVWLARPQARKLNDRELVREAVKKII